MFSDALDREADWLNTAVADGLPLLPKAAGGAWPLIQARWPRTQRTLVRGIYVLRSPDTSYQLVRFANVRTQPSTRFRLRLFWPITSGTGSAEADQLAFDKAIDDVVARIAGLPFDKTHGGRFLSVAEDHQGITVHLSDPEEALAKKAFDAVITYSADDNETTN